MAGNRSGRGCVSSLFNILTVFFLGVTLLALIGFIVALTAPDLVADVAGALGLEGGDGGAAGPTPTRVQVAIVPSATNTLEATRGLAPTWTPERPAGALPATATNTRRPTSEPSITPTFPPPTPTRTPTATPTMTPTAGPSPTVTATRSQFPFTKDDVSPQYLSNFANNAGCNWMGVAGEVLDLARNPVPSGSYQVHVWGSGIDERVPVGGAPAYSPAGWEQFLFDAPVVRDYDVQLESTNGTPVSQAYPVQTRASCNQNLVLFTFIQNH